MGSGEALAKEHARSGLGLSRNERPNPKRPLSQFSIRMAIKFFKLLLIQEFRRLVNWPSLCPSDSVVKVQPILGFNHGGTEEQGRGISCQVTDKTASLCLSASVVNVLSFLLFKFGFNHSGTRPLN